MAYTTIDDPSAHFQTALYSGNGSNGHVITNDGNSDLQPDFFWQKRRNEARNHILIDTSRGGASYLASNSTAAAGTDYTYVTSFNSDGFTLASGDTSSNNASGTYVAWQWKANGGTTASNSDGSITSTVQANQDAGFSIVTYTGTGNTATVGHGLGVAPKIIIGKRRSQAANWWVGGSILTSAQTLYLNLTNAIDNVGEAGIFNVTTSTTFKLGTDTNRNAHNATNVAYCFAEKQGYSKFGSYVGNGNADGTFVYTGFKPAWVMTKETGAAGSWVIYDNKRDTFNPETKLFSAEAASEEATYTQYDFVSNGFKFRSSGSENSNGNTHIYMAFAENPFTTSTGIPTTAR